jgi:hypothetical protein
MHYLSFLNVCNYSFYIISIDFVVFNICLCHNPCSAKPGLQWARLTGPLNLWLSVTDVLLRDAWEDQSQNTKIHFSKLTVSTILTIPRWSRSQEPDFSILVCYQYFKGCSKNLADYELYVSICAYISTNCVTLWEL